MKLQKAHTIALFIFAAIGAIASIAAIISFARPSSAQLTVTIHPNRFAVPLYIQAVFASRYKDNPVNLIQSSLIKNCIANNNIQEINGLKCDEIRSLKLAADGVSDLTKSSKSTLYEINIENTGRSQAKGIKLSANFGSMVDIFNEDDVWIESEVDKSGNYIIPDLNPGSNEKVFVWTPDFPYYDYEGFSEFEKAPKITYANGSVATETWIHAPRLYSDVFGFLNTFNWTFQIIIIIVFFFLVFVSFALIIGILQVIFTEKTWAQVFAVEKPVDPEPVITAE